MNLLMLGDIVGKPGRECLNNHLRDIRDAHDIDYVIANAENACGGLGIDHKSAHELLDAGVDFMTLGNHLWSKKSWLRDADDFAMIARPLNGPDSWPGYPYVVAETRVGNLLLLNLCGNVFMNCAADPFQTLEQQLDELKDRFNAKVTLVDFHAEATSEKQAMGYFLQDRVTAIWGTHTHVQTADCGIIGNGTAYITDLGMTGSMSGVLGMSRDVAMRRFVEQLPAPYSVEEDPPYAIQGMIVEVDERSGQAINAERFQYWVNE